MGYNMATDDLSSNREEIEKAVGGILLSAREAVVFDNVDTDKPLDSGLLASIITQPKRSVRPLGTITDGYDRELCDVLLYRLQCRSQA